MVRVAVGLGSNLQQPQQQIEQALQALAQMSEGSFQCSSLYRTPPMGPQDQPDYINAVALFETSLKPIALLDRLQQIEQRQGRERKRHWGERTLDLDLLLYGEQSVDLPRLQVPHPGTAQRAFVLVPLHEVAGGQCRVPGLGTVAQLLEQCDCSEIEQFG